MFYTLYQLAFRNSYICIKLVFPSSKELQQQAQLRQTCLFIAKTSKILAETYVNLTYMFSSIWTPTPIHPPQESTSLAHNMEGPLLCIMNLWMHYHLQHICLSIRNNSPNGKWVLTKFCTYSFH